MSEWLEHPWLLMFVVGVVCVTVMIAVAAAADAVIAIYTKRPMERRQLPDSLPVDKDLVYEQRLSTVEKRLDSLQQELVEIGHRVKLPERAG